MASPSVFGGGDGSLPSYQEAYRGERQGLIEDPQDAGIDWFFPYERISQWMYQQVPEKGNETNPRYSLFGWWCILAKMLYEIYVIPGMFLALLWMVLRRLMDHRYELEPLRFHILPHLLSFSIAHQLKSLFPRIRPGCQRLRSGTTTRLRALSSRSSIHPLDCLKKGNESFPSGHTMVAFSMLCGLGLTLFDHPPCFYPFPILRSLTIRILLFMVFAWVAVGTALQRIADGYHRVSDVLSGILLGIVVGYISYHLLPPSPFQKGSKEVQTSPLSSVVIKRKESRHRTRSFSHSRWFPISFSYVLGTIFVMLCVLMIVLEIQQEIRQTIRILGKRGGTSIEDG